MHPCTLRWLGCGASRGYCSWFEQPAQGNCIAACGLGERKLLQLVPGTFHLGCAHRCTLLLLHCVLCSQDDLLDDVLDLFGADDNDGTDDNDGMDDMDDNDGMDDDGTKDD